jgi:hypothetical protein
MVTGWDRHEGGSKKRRDRDGEGDPAYAEGEAQAAEQVMHVRAEQHPIEAYVHNYIKAKAMAARCGGWGASRFVHGICRSTRPHF